jgi:hypothetical protein
MTGDHPSVRHFTYVAQLKLSSFESEAESAPACLLVVGAKPVDTVRPLQDGVPARAPSPSNPRPARPFECLRLATPLWYAKIDSF